MLWLRLPIKKKREKNKNKNMVSRFYDLHTLIFNIDSRMSFDDGSGIYDGTQAKKKTERLNDSIGAEIVLKNGVAHRLQHLLNILGIGGGGRVRVDLPLFAVLVRCDTIGKNKSEKVQGGGQH
jgi:hypothetical protein